MLRIEHTLSDGNVWYSQYGHMENGSLTKNIGDWVQMGENLGTVGSTGFSTGPHLHLEIKRSNSDGAGYGGSNCDDLGFTEPLEFIRDRLFDQGTWYYWDFDNAGQKDGWGAFEDCGWSVGNGTLVQCQGPDPRLVSPLMDRTVDSNFYVKIDAANTGSRSDGNVFLETVNYGFNSTNRVTFTLPNGGSYHNIVIPLKNIPGYDSGGNWRRFRIDPVGANGDGNTFVQYIRYGSDNVAPVISSSSVTPSVYTRTNSFTVTWNGTDGPDDGSGFGSGIHHYEVRKNEGNWVGQGLNTSWTGTGQECTNTFDIRAIDVMGNVGSHVRKFFYLDTTDPTNPTTVTSGSHDFNTWSRDRTVGVSWSGAGDGCGSGIDGYSWIFDQASGTVPNQSMNTSGTNATSPTLDDGIWYFHVKSVDEVENWASGAKHAGEFWIDNTRPSPPTNATSSSHIPGECSTDQTIDMCWSGAADGDGSGIYGYSVIWTLSPTTLPNTTVNTTETCHTSNVLADGIWYYHIRPRDVVGRWSEGAAHFGPYCIDASGPPVIPAVESTSHVPSEWSVDPTVAVQWDPASDPDSGISGYSFEWSGDPGTEPDDTVDTTDTNTTSDPLAEGLSWYFHVLAVNGVGIAGPASHLGPFWIDHTPPGVTVLEPNGGEVWRHGEVHQIRWQATDGHSGVDSLKIWYSTDAGSTYPNFLGSVPAGVTSFDWTIPEEHSDGAMVRVDAYDLAGNSGSDESDLPFTLGGLSGDLTPMAMTYELRPNYPNPFNPSTTIAYSVPEDINASLRIFDMRGRLVRTLVSGTVSGGIIHTVTWDGLNDRGEPVDSGVYFYRFINKDFSETRKMVLLK